MQFGAWDETGVVFGFLIHPENSRMDGIRMVGQGEGTAEPGVYHHGTPRQDQAKRDGRAASIGSQARSVTGELVMKAYQHEPAHAHDRWRTRLRSVSLFHSLIIATVAGFIVASVGIVLFALSRYLQIPWPIAAAAGGVGQAVIVGFLLVIVLEQRRTQLVRHARELTFLNHHIWNAITQISLASSLTDPEKQQRIRCEAVERISGALRRVADSADLDRLSLEVDLAGMELIRQGADAEEVDKQRTA
jgi:hypothetical protein